jgi:hypothetical protein
VEQYRFGLDVFASIEQRAAEIGISLGEVGLDAGGLAKCGDGLVGPAQMQQGLAEVGMGCGVVGFDSDRMEQCRSPSTCSCRSNSAQPRLE